MSWFKSDAPMFQQLLNLGLILSIAVDFFILNTMDMVANPKSSHTFGLLIMVSMILGFGVLSYHNRENPGYPLTFSNFMGASKPFFALVSLLMTLFVVMLYTVDQTPGLWEIFLPTHLILTTYYLLHDSKFQTQPWVPIMREIEYNMEKKPGTILRMLPVENSNQHYRTTEKFQPVPGQKGRHNPQYTAYLVKDDSTSRRKIYSLITSSKLLNIRNASLSLSISNLTKLEQRAATHLLIMHLFRENHNEVYNLSRIVKSRTSVKYKLSNDQFTEGIDSITVVHNWTLAAVNRTANHLLDALTKKNSFEEERPFSELFDFHFGKLPDRHGAKFLLSYLILLSGDYEPEQNNGQWLNFNLAFAYVARKVWSSQSNIFRCNNSGRLRPKYIQDLIEKIITIRDSPVENFIEIHDQIVVEIRGIRSENEEATRIQQTYLKDMLDDIMNNMAKNLFNIPGEENNSRIATKNSRKEIVSGTSVGLYCMLDMLRGD